MDNIASEVQALSWQQMFQSLNVYMFTGAVYICTEDVFPNKRLHQLTESFSRYHTQSHPKLTAKYLSDNIYIEHVATIVSWSWAQAACVYTYTV